MASQPRSTPSTASSSRAKVSRATIGNPQSPSRNAPHDTSLTKKPPRRSETPAPVSQNPRETLNSCGQARRLAPARRRARTLGSHRKAWWRGGGGTTRTTTSRRAWSIISSWCAWPGPRLAALRISPGCSARLSARLDIIYSCPAAVVPSHLTPSPKPWPVLTPCRSISTGDGTPARTDLEDHCTSRSRRHAACGLEPAVGGRDLPGDRRGRGGQGDEADEAVVLPEH